jgi:hypothetical protein
MTMAHCQCLRSALVACSTGHVLRINCTSVFMEAAYHVQIPFEKYFHHRTPDEMIGFRLSQHTTSIPSRAAQTACFALGCLNSPTLRLKLVVLSERMACDRSRLLTMQTLLPSV